jgi:hypothetical protein
LEKKMTTAQWYAFLDVIKFNYWGFAVLGLIVGMGLVFWNIRTAKKNYAQQDDDKVGVQPGDAYSNRTKVGKRAAAYRATRPNQKRK